MKFMNIFDLGAPLIGLERDYEDPFAFRSDFSLLSLGLLDFVGLAML